MSPLSTLKTLSSLSKFAHLCNAPMVRSYPADAFLKYSNSPSFLIRQTGLHTGALEITRVLVLTLNF